MVIYESIPQDYCVDSNRHQADKDSFPYCIAEVLCVYNESSVSQHLPTALTLQILYHEPSKKAISAYRVHQMIKAYWPKHAGEVPNSRSTYRRFSSWRDRGLVIMNGQSSYQLDLPVGDPFKNAVTLCIERLFPFYTGWHPKASNYKREFPTLS